MKINVKKLPKGEVEIEGELEEAIFESYFDEALRKIGKNVKIDGFREGKVPDNILLSKIPEISILEEMAELALSVYYPKIINGELGTEKIDAIGRPEIAITKLARKNPLGFKIKTAVLPTIKLPDYKKIGKSTVAKNIAEAKDLEVSEEELENTIMDIRKSRAPKKPMAEAVEEMVGKDGEQKTETPESDLPEFNDEFVQALGPFTSINDFKSKLKDNIKLEKENKQKEKTRIEIIEKIIQDSVVDVPDILTEIEIDKIIYRMESDITAMGLKFEDYLKQLGKNKEDIRKEFRTEAEKKAKLGLILNEISKIENITPDEEEVGREIAHILEHYKDADPERARIHAENVLTNEKIFAFLEAW